MVNQQCDVPEYRSEGLIMRELKTVLPQVRFRSNRRWPEGARLDGGMVATETPRERRPVPPMW